MPRSWGIAGHMIRQRWRGGRWIGEGEIPLHCQKQVTPASGRDATRHVMTHQIYPNLNSGRTWWTAFDAIERSCMHICRAAITLFVWHFFLLAGHHWDWLRCAATISSKRMIQRSHTCSGYKVRHAESQSSTVLPKPKGFIPLAMRTTTYCFLLYTYCMITYTTCIIMFCWWLCEAIFFSRTFLISIRKSVFALHRVISSRKLVSYNGRICNITKIVRTQKFPGLPC